MEIFACCILITSDLSIGKFHIKYWNSVLIPQNYYSFCMQMKSNYRKQLLSIFCNKYK